LDVTTQADEGVSGPRAETSVGPVESGDDRPLARGRPQLLESPRDHAGRLVLREVRGGAPSARMSVRRGRRLKPRRSPHCRIAPLQNRSTPGVNRRSPCAALKSAKLARMHWDDLRVFLALAQAGSLRRAARALQLGQPTVVRRLRQLEEALGARLFERHPDGHRLTTAGRELIPMAQSMAETATAIARRRAALGDEAGGTVRVAAGEWAAHFLASRLARLPATRPELVIELIEVHVDPDLDRHEADLVLSHGLNAPGHLVRIGLRS